MEVPKPIESIGIIPDGNRRAARRLMKQPWKGHEWGAKKIEEVIEWCKELGIKKIIIYAFSLKNFKSRPKREFDFLMNLFYKEFSRMKDDPRLEKDKVRVNFIGRIDMFPENLNSVMKELMDKTKNNDNFIVNFAMAYDGRAEVTDAIKRISKDVKEGNLNINDINESLISKYLYFKDNVDLVIRTSGEKRTSGFLPWQADYAELAFIPNYWPDLTKEEFVATIEDFKNRQRRFGK